MPLIRLAPLALALAAAFAPVAAAAQTGPALDPAVRAAFVAEVAEASGMPAAEVDALLSQARYQQGIVNAMDRPAEAKPWRDYRPIFITDQRIRQGRAFLAEHRVALAEVEAATGVPAEFIVAIIGVETSYGGNTGSHRVLDALYTLGFHYPRREAFFRAELGHLFTLARAEQLDIPALRGSYAGAMGLGQFMPSSYLAYAKDGDGDGRRDLFTSLPDVFASIANYFVAHGWKPGEPVLVPAVFEQGREEFVPENLEASHAIADLAARGYAPAGRLAVLPATGTVLNLDGAQGREYWMGFQNFYVITRYNRSPLYAMAVNQLAGAIAEGDVAPAAAPAAPAPSAGE